MKFCLLFLSVLFIFIATSCAKSKFVEIDGSSTVFPITEAVAVNFKEKAKDIRVTVGISGTGGGFKRFCRGETVISGASRPIKESEIELCKQNKINYIELPIAYDGLTVVVHPTNTWAKSIKVSELKKPLSLLLHCVLSSNTSIKTGIASSCPRFPKTFIA